MAQSQPIGTVSKNIWQFDPRILGSCIMWIDASDRNTFTLTSNNVVSTIIDKSVLKSSMTVTNINVPLGSNGGYYWSSNRFNTSYPAFYTTSALVSVNIGATTSLETYGVPLTTFVVAKYDGLSSSGNSFLYDSPNRIALNGPISANSITNGLSMGTASNTSITAPFPTGTYPSGNFIHSGVYNGSNSAMYVNGALSASGTLGTGVIFGTGTVTIGSRFSSTQAWWGSICEVLFFNRNMETQDRQTIEGYLAWKWGLQATLPTTHPYNTATGTIIRPFARQFYPVDIPNCVLWLDAMDGSTVTLTSNAVSTWIDKSGYGNNATQANTSNRPTYANSAITFASGSSQFLSFTSPASLPSGTSAATTNGTYFFVTRLITGGAVRAFCMYGPTTLATGANPQFYYNASNQLVVDTFGAGVTTNTANADSNNVVVLSATITGGASVAGYRNSVVFGPTSYTANTITSQKGFIGMTQTGVGTTGTNASYFDGRVHEVIFYNGVLTTSQRQRVESYLMWKWGNRSLFATTFPFYVIPNNTVTPFNPRNISGLALWLDAADPATVTIGPTPPTSVTAWIDKSGNGRNATFTGATNTLSYSTLVQNGLGAIGGFTTIGYLATGTTNFDFGANDFAMFAVLRAPSNVTSNYPIITKNFSVTANNTNSWGLMLTSTSLASMRYTTSGATNVTANTGAVSASTWYILSGNAVRTGTATTTSLNGTAGTAVAGNNTGINPGTVAIQIGATTVATAGSFNNAGLIGEIIIYNGTISFTQQQQIEGYLAWKWDLERNIRTSHPFYKIAS